MAASIFYEIISFCLLFSGFLPATRAQNLDLSFAENHSCNERCQKLVNVGTSWEATQHVSINDPFYSPTGILPAQPGQLIDVEEVTNLTNYTVPSGLTMSRFTYTTSDVNGTVLPASAYILWPYMNAQESTKFNVVAWAHGTSGVYAPCAPSNYQNLQYDFQVPFALALDGYAVVAPDYAGLGVGRDTHGNIIPHLWALGTAQANDLAYAISSARLAFPDNVSNDFVVMGHSQGGGVAWAFAQRQAQTPICGYRGAVAVAPAINILAQLHAVRANPVSFTLEQALLSLRAIASVNVTFPGYNFAGASTLGRQREEVLGEVEGCLPTNSLLLSDIHPLTSLVKANWTSDPTVQAWGALAETGGKTFKGPLLVLASEADSTTLIRFVREAVDQTCNTAVLGDEDLEFVSFEGLEHFPLIQGARGLWRRWIEDRLRHGEKESEKGCRKKRVSGFRVQDTKISVMPNWLLSVPGVTEAWKAAL
ncbi:MAG: hypothetical protein Q9160_006006 [Pyrenula sp. 1 TL-2023]